VTEKEDELRDVGDEDGDEDVNDVPHFLLVLGCSQIMKLLLSAECHCESPQDHALKVQTVIMISVLISV
jgi:hypothetical protein